MRRMEAALSIWILAVGGSCRSVSPPRAPVVPPTDDVEARSNVVASDGPVLGFVAYPSVPESPSPGRAVPQEAAARVDEAGRASGIGLAGAREGGAVPAEAGTRVRASGARASRQEVGRESRRYRLRGNDDGAVHLEVLERPDDQPQLPLDPSLPRRLQDYSEPPAEIRNRFQRIRCVPCPWQ